MMNHASSPFNLLIFGGHYSSGQAPYWSPRKPSRIAGERFLTGQKIFLTASIKFAVYECMLSE